MKSWSDSSIAARLYFVIGTMAVLIACELLTLRLAMHTLSAVRAFVEGEGSWSKAQKDAAFSLERYALTRREEDFNHFLEQLKIPEGDHQARIELEKPSFDREVVRRGFLQGQLHPDDVDPVVDLLRRFHSVSYIGRAVAVWTSADQQLEELKRAGTELHLLLQAGGRDRAAIEAVLGRIGLLNQQLTSVEAEFSAVLGEGSRWMERVVISLLVLAVLTVETIGLGLTFRTTRALSRGLAEANLAARNIGEGHFDVRLPIRSADELGALAQSVNQMGILLERSYRDLEGRVAARTSELQAMANDNAKLFEQASAAVQMRDEFLSIASHELKTPLAALLLQLQLLERRFDETGATPMATAEKRTLLQLSLRQGRRLARLSDELLDLTRIRLGKLELQREPCDLVSLVREAVSQLHPEALRGASTLEITAPAPLTGQFDPARIGQVVTNLVSNAIKYGNSRPITIGVRRQGESALIEVRDQGVGIGPEDRARIFERFERAARDRRIAGLGLGLYISRQIVARHGGTISVQSQLGQGSTFTVELPLS